MKNIVRKRTQLPENSSLPEKRVSKQNSQRNLSEFGDVSATSAVKFLASTSTALPTAPSVCYKPNMRKWMRERLKRRKKDPAKIEEKAAPLQPAYFEAEATTPAQILHSEAMPSATEAEPLPAKAPTPVMTHPPKLQAPKGVVVLAIGLPGSGKSSWFKRHSITPLSSDMLRSLLFDDPTEQRY